MDPQLKKGLLDVCILKCLTEADSYGYKLIIDISTYLEISESTLYPILKRLEEQGHLTTYKEEHNSRIRKYYKITTDGKKRFKELLKEIKKLSELISFLIGEKSHE